MSSSVPSRSLLWLVDLAAIKHMGQTLPDLCMSIIAARVGRAKVPKTHRTTVTLEREIVVRGSRKKKWDSSGQHHQLTRYRIKKAFRWR